MGELQLLHGFGTVRIEATTHYVPALPAPFANPPPLRRSYRTPTAGPGLRMCAPLPCQVYPVNRALLLLVALLMPLSCAAAPAAPSTSPQAPRITLKASPVPGIKEVRSGGQVAYMSEDGKWLFAGDLIEVKSGKNVSELARAGARAVALAESDKRDHVIYGPKDGKRRIYVFTDVSCPYCRRFHEEVPKLVAQGITVEYLAWPRGGASGEGFAPMQSVWCSSDRVAAMDATFHGKPVAPAACVTPLRKHYELGASLDVRGTPAIFDSEGNMLGGYVPAERIMEALASAAAANPAPKAP